MGGREYWTGLLKTLQTERKSDLRQLTMEIFTPVDEEYMQELAKIKIPHRADHFSRNRVSTVSAERMGENTTNEGLYPDI